MKTVLVIHTDSVEGNKIKDVLNAGGYDAQTADILIDGYDMVLMCRDSMPVTIATEKIFCIDGFSIDFPARKVIADGRKIHLTPIEFRIVSLLAKNQGVVLTHEQIINEIWGPFNSDNLVLRVNMANIRRKIEANPSEPKYILTEMGVGYRMALPNHDTGID